MAGSLALRVSTTDSVYPAGTPVDVALTVTNDSTRPVTLQFRSGQRYDFLVLDSAGDTLHHWSADKGFVQMLGEEQLGPGESLEFLETIDRPLEPGRYPLVGVLTSSSHPLEARTTFTVR